MGAILIQITPSQSSVHVCLSSVCGVCGVYGYECVLSRACEAEALEVMRTAGDWAQQLLQLARTGFFCVGGGVARGLS